MIVGHILIHNPFFSLRVAMGDHKLEPAESQVAFPGQMFEIIVCMFWHTWNTSV